MLKENRLDGVLADLLRKSRVSSVAMLNPSSWVACQTPDGRLGRRRAAAGGRQRVAELSPLGHAMPADPTRGPEAGWRQRA